MDDNKRKVLEDLKYEIRRACGNCHFADLNGEWGTCKRIQYSHAKHNKTTRNLSINRFGVCSEHIFLDSFTNLLGKYSAFIKDF